ncbi:MAG: alkaline phosphatase family protein [Myxococcales bacterium]|nr:alkaline phosphatase family protein [Myxococcales bacterium]
MPAPCVVLVILDGFPHAKLSPDLAPNLWALASTGGRAPTGGRAVLSASTYPNHASFVTGVEPGVHRILTSNAWIDGAFHPAQAVGPQARTLFDRCRAAGRSSAALFGDQNLVGVCGARGADAHWPPDGVLPDTAPRGALGYGADRAVLAALEELDLDALDLLVLQLDEVDTARHLHGPESPEALAQCRATDAAFGQVLECVRPRWDRAVVIALSDHDHEAVTPGAIDLTEATASLGLGVLVDHDGTAALLAGALDPARLPELPGVEGFTAVASDCTLVWGAPGQQFGIDWGLKGHHGSPRTATQLAIVGGGHPAVPNLARQLAKRAPAASSWAGLIGQLLEL